MKTQIATWTAGILAHHFNCRTYRSTRAQSKLCVILGHCFPNVLLQDPFWLRKITKDPHILARVNTVSGWQVSKINVLHLGIDFRYEVRIHTSNIRYNSFHDLTLLNWSQLASWVQGKGKGKAIPLQAWTGLEGFRRLRPQISRQSAHESGKVVTPTHRPPLPPRKYSWYSFLLQAESTRGYRVFLNWIF